MMKARFSSLRQLDALLLVILCCSGVWTTAQTPAELSIHLYAGLTITGTVGKEYAVQYTTNLNGTQAWTVLTNLTLPISPYFWVDTSCPATGRRFYLALAVSQPPPKVPANMVSIPAGSFMMGDTFAEDSNALPLHTVYVSQFYMDKYLVTLELWNRVKTWAKSDYDLPAAGGNFTSPVFAAGDNYPVQFVTWNDALKWCNARSQMDGLTPVYYVDAGLTVVFKTGVMSPPFANWKANGYRLPTEAEWEKAARGAVAGQRFPWGNTISHKQANYESRPDVLSYDLGPEGLHPNCRKCQDNVFLGYAPAIVCPTPVGYFQANGYGLYDMAGNAAEWCWDFFNSYSSDTQTDPTGPGKQVLSNHGNVLRGGSSVLSAGYACCASRGWWLKGSIAWYYSQGFRCVRRL